MESKSEENSPNINNIAATARFSVTSPEKLEEYPSNVRQETSGSPTNKKISSSSSSSSSSKDKSIVSSLTSASSAVSRQLETISEYTEELRMRKMLEEKSETSEQIRFESPNIFENDNINYNYNFLLLYFECDEMEQKFKQYLYQKSNENSSKLITTAFVVCIFGFGIGIASSIMGGNALLLSRPVVLSTYVITIANNIIALVIFHCIHRTYLLPIPMRQNPASNPTSGVNNEEIESKLSESSPAILNLQSSSYSSSFAVSESLSPANSVVIDNGAPNLSAEYSFSYGSSVSPGPNNQQPVSTTTSTTVIPPPTIRYVLVGRSTIVLQITLLLSLFISSFYIIYSGYCESTSYYCDARGFPYFVIFCMWYISLHFLLFSGARWWHCSILSELASKLLIGIILSFNGNIRTTVAVQWRTFPIIYFVFCSCVWFWILYKLHLKELNLFIMRERQRRDCLKRQWNEINVNAWDVLF